MRMALMIIDLQKAYYKDDAKRSMDSACAYINGVLGRFRAKGLPVIWVQHIDEYDGSLPGKEDFDFIDALKPLEGEHRIEKKYGNSFNKTNCAEIVKKEEVDTLILSGYCAEYCVLSTYRGALDLDLAPIILRNGLASDNEANIKFVENISNIISYGALMKMLDK